jgi:hypothetical protein
MFVFRMKVSKKGSKSMKEEKSLRLTETVQGAG